MIQLFGVVGVGALGEDFAEPASGGGEEEGAAEDQEPAAGEDAGDEAGAGEGEDQGPDGGADLWLLEGEGCALAGCLVALEGAGGGADGAIGVDTEVGEEL